MRTLLALLVALTTLPALAADDALKPFVLASRGAGDPAAAVAETRAKLEGAGFQVVGSYEPYPGATVLAFTNPFLTAAAAAAPGASYAAFSPSLPSLPRATRQRGPCCGLRPELRRNWRTAP